jgi:DNA-binding SARP family transcriptional activator
MLGPLEVLDAGGRIPLGGPKQRALLAVLLLHANEVVSVDRLADELWGERPPASAPKLVQGYVSALRRLLHGNGGGRGPLETRPRGYVLRLEGSDELDLYAFERLAAEARAAAEPAVAAGRLREALALWRGPVLADVVLDGPGRQEAERLSERRLGALVERIELDLELGRHADVVGELEALVAAHSFQERLPALLILALYRSGRQAEALQVYGQTRRRLVDELGLEPSEELQRLERQILVHDPVLEPPAPPAPPLRAVTPPRVQKMRKTVTVLLADASGWPGLLERLDPEAAHGLASRYHTMAARVLVRHGGTVKELGGQSVIGLFGFPVSREDDALRAIRAALDLRSELQPFEEELVGDLGVGVGLRLAIDTGEVVAAVGPVDDALVVGNALDAAARLAGVAGPQDILIGAATHGLVAGAVRDEPFEHVTDRGDRVGGWRLLGPSVERPGFSSPFVGRARERAGLRDVLARATRTRSCQLCTVVGPPGIGKSRLTREVADEISRTVTLTVGRCLSYGEGITYWPLREIIDDLTRGQPRDWIKARLEPDVSATAIAERVAAAVGAGGGGAQPHETFWAFRRLFEELASERPLVLVIDDVHWAEPTLLDLLEHLVGFSSSVPILVLCLARPELFEMRPEWAVPQANRTVISLEPLPVVDSRALVEGLERAQELAGPARTRAVEAAEGNPLFLEQLVAFTADGGSAVVPPSIHALLDARIDRLEAGERAVLERAAIEGRAFHRASLSDLLPADQRARIDDWLLALVRKDFIEPRRSMRGTEDAFRFRHVLVRDAAYESIAKELRAELHERYADWLDARGGEDEIVGYHLEQASGYHAEVAGPGARLSELPVRAAERLASAGRSALKRGDIHGAVNLLSRASALPQSDAPARLQFLPDLGEALSSIGELARAGEVLTEAGERAEAAQDAYTAWRARLQQTWLRLQADPSVQVTEVLTVAKAAAGAFKLLGDDRALAHSWHLIAWVHMTYGRLAALADAVRQGREHARAAGDAMTEEDLTVLAILVTPTGPLPTRQVISEAEAELESARAGGSRRVEAAALLVLAMCAAFEGRFEQARELLAEATSIDEELGGGRASGFQYTPAGVIELLAGDAPQAEAVLRSGYETLRDMGDAWFLCGVAAELADALWLQGRDDEAYDFTRLSEEMVGEDVLVAQMMWRGARAKVLARRGQSEEAEALAREGVAIIEATDYVLYHADALTDLAEVLRLQNRAEEAATAAEKALRLYEQKGVVVAARALQAMLEELRTPTAVDG